MHVYPHICLCATGFYPLLRQSFAILAVDFHRHNELLDVKPCCKNDCITLGPYTICTSNTCLVNVIDPYWGQLNIAAMETFQVVRVKDTPFAALV